MDVLKAGLDLFVGVLEAPVSDKTRYFDQGMRNDLVKLLGDLSSQISELENAMQSLKIDKAQEYVNVQKSVTEVSNSFDSILKLLIEDPKTPESEPEPEPEPEPATQVDNLPVGSEEEALLALMKKFGLITISSKLVQHQMEMTEEEKTSVKTAFEVPFAEFALSDFSEELTPQVCPIDWRRSESPSARPPPPHATPHP
jgi:DNA-binding HxlR family transcriptional regulator